MFKVSFDFSKKKQPVSRGSNGQTATRAPIIGDFGGSY